MIDKFIVNTGNPVQIVNIWNICWQIFQKGLVKNKGETSKSIH